MKAKRLYILLMIIFGTLDVFSITCVRPDWVDEFCNLPDVPGSRCANQAFFKFYCNNSTAGCSGDCVGAVAPGHWYPITKDNGMPTHKCRCGCFSEHTLFGSRKISGRELISNHEKHHANVVESILSLTRFEFTKTSKTTINNIDGIIYSNGSNELVFNLMTRDHSIIVSAGHPVPVFDDQRRLIAIKRASDLMVNEQLLNEKGKSAKILKIEKKVAKDFKMMNFNVKSNKMDQHLIYANGLLMGDLVLQDKVNSLESRKMWRSELIAYLERKK